MNEIAPRVHNSGHITLDNASMSQFELHIKAITNDKSQTQKLLKGLMRNLIGSEIKRAKQISKLKSIRFTKKRHTTMVKKQLNKAVKWAILIL